MDARQERMLEELHDAIIGSVGKPGLMEQVRDIDRRLTRVETIATKGLAQVWERFLTVVASGAAAWIAAHFSGTRP